MSVTKEDQLINRVAELETSLEDKNFELVKYREANFKLEEEKNAEIAKLRDSLLGVTETDMKTREACFVLMRAYLEKKFNYTLLYPSIIVRVIPKPDKFGMLILPEAYRNKPVYEGVVVQTWEKKTVQTSKGEIVMTPTFKLGDIVLFHHWAGAPVPFVDDFGEEYRLIPDKHLFNKPGVLDDAAPFVIIDTDKENPKTYMKTILDESGLLPVGWTSDAIVSHLFKEFDIVPKHTISLTGYVEPTKPS